MTVRGTRTAVSDPAHAEQSRLSIRDGLAITVVSLLTRRLRSALTGAGVAIGIAAMVAVLGVATSSRTDLIAKLDELGTDLLTARPGQSFVGTETALPPSAPAAIRRIGSVDQAAAVAEVDATVRRTNYVPRTQTGGIWVASAEASLLATLEADLAAGRFFDTVTDEHPTTVLGDTAARRLGITSLDDQPLVWLGDRWFAVVGLLRPLFLAPEIDNAALIGFAAAEQILAISPDQLRPTMVYIRARPEAIDDVRSLLGPTANPESPEAVRISRPSDALAARDAAFTSFTALLLGLGAIALVVGGVGIANVMVISVHERRTEIGLRRALGATRRHIGAQFLTEAIVLSSVGGVAGMTIGAGITAAFAAARGWSFELPFWGLAGAVVLVAIVGAVAGLYPAIQAARLQPADAVRPR